MSRKRHQPRGRDRHRTEKRKPSQHSTEKPKKPSGSTQKVIGVLLLHSNGFGFVVPEGCVPKGPDDVFIPAHRIGHAMHGDQVEVEASGALGRREGCVTKIVSRGTKHITGKIARFGTEWVLQPEDSRVRARVRISPDRLGGAKEGQRAVVRLIGYPEKEGQMLEGQVLDVLGPRGELAAEFRTVIIQHQLPEEFPAEVIQEAESKRMTEEDYADREDLRSLPFVTIDGETARDFDDAVCVQQADGNTLRLWVAIADVSHFVRPGTALDDEAYARGTSVYFPGHCLPMLPEALSNDLCSLRPDEDRFAMAACMDIDARGHIVSSRFCSAVIRSRRRMTYTEVKRVLVTRELPARDALGPLLPELERMQLCYERLRKARQARGTMDFDLPEPQIELDMQGKVEDILKAERHMGHMLIEECMIAANQAVAFFLTNARVGCMYRIHDRPDPAKLQDISVLMHNLGHNVRVSGDMTPAKLARWIQMVHGSPEERLVNHLLLRAMAKAVYSETNIGHFGLGLTHYAHFTSPIRRYPDLIVHRLLRRALGEQGARAAQGKAQLHEAALHCSRRERVAMEAEREMAKLYAASFMLERQGQEFEGMVSHVTKFGFFVELVDVFVEGFVPMESLVDDTYRFDMRSQSLLGSKRRTQAIRIGDRVTVHLRKVNIPAREIEFELKGR